MLTSLHTDGCHHMNLLQRTLIEKAGNEHGFEYVPPGDEDGVHLASALRRVQVRIVSEESGVALMFPPAGFRLLPIELAGTLPAAAMPGDRFIAADLEALGIVLRRATKLDTWYARAYGFSRDELRNFGEYRTRRMALEAWDKLSPSDPAIRQEASPC